MGKFNGAENRIPPKNPVKETTNFKNSTQNIPKNHSLPLTESRLNAAESSPSRKSIKVKQDPKIKDKLFKKGSSDENNNYFTAKLEDA